MKRRQDAGNAVPARSAVARDRGANSVRFHFAEAHWFRVPLKVLVLTTVVFGLIALYPALSEGTPDDYRRALFGVLVVLAFAAAATTVAVAVSDGYVDIDGDTLAVRFEAFFNATVPIEDIVAVRAIDPRPRWRYRWGLSTNFTDVIGCSHGGRFVEVELARPCEVRVWWRTIAVRRYWLAIREHERFIDELRARLPEALAEQRAA